MAEVGTLPNRAEWHYNQGNTLLSSVIEHKDEDRKSVV